MACDMWHVTQFMTSHAILVIIWHVQQWQIYYQQCTKAISAHHNMDMVTGWRQTRHTWHVTCDKSPKRLVTWSQPFYDPLKQKNNPKNKEYSTFERGGFWSPSRPRLSLQIPAFNRVKKIRFLSNAMCNKKCAMCNENWANNIFFLKNQTNLLGPKRKYF